MGEKGNFVAGIGRDDVGPSDAGVQEVDGGSIPESQPGRSGVIGWWRSETGLFFRTFGVFVAVSILIMVPVFMIWGLPRRPSALGDSFGVLNAILSVLALVYVAHTLRQQTEQLKLQREDMEKQNEAQRQQTRAQREQIEAQRELLDLERANFERQARAAVRQERMREFEIYRKALETAVADVTLGSEELEGEQALERFVDELDGRFRQSACADERAVESRFNRAAEDLGYDDLCLDEALELVLAFLDEVHGDGDDAILKVCRVGMRPAMPASAWRLVKTRALFLDARLLRRARSHGLATEDGSGFPVVDRLLQSKGVY